MNARRLVLRGLLHHRRTHLGAFGAAALTAAVIVAALGVGDSVRTNLARVADARIGRVGFAAHARDRMWCEDLATTLSTDLGAPVSGALRLNGTLARPDGSARIARARVLGVDETFWSLSPGGRLPLSPWPDDGIAVSERVASRLRLEVGDPLIVRFEKPSLLPREAPLRSDADAMATLSATVAAVIDAPAFGRFALEIGPLAPANIFLPRARLQRAADEPGRVNMLLSRAGNHDARTLEEAVRRSWRIEDAGLSLRRLDRDRGWQLESRRVFLEPAVVAAAAASSALTWMVNDLAVRDRHTPYSMVTALPLANRLIPDDLTPDEIVVNAWLAEDLAAGVGDTLTLRYFIPAEGRRLEERSTALRIRAIVPLEGEAADPDLMPAFPGLIGMENCRDWDPGFALDLERIRDEDEAYWDDHRGTPKAFVSAAAGRRLWSNPFGPATAVRYPPDRSRETIEEALKTTLDPAAFGLRFTDLGSAGAVARAQGMDFGALFLGFSAFLVMAALLLMGLVVALNVEMRQPEIATLLALGFTPRRVRRQFAIEHALVALAGGVLGAAVGLGLGSAALAALDTVWSDVAGSLVMTLSVRPMTVVVGALAGAVVSFAVAAVILRITIRPSIVSTFTRREELAARISRSHTRFCYGRWFGLAFLIGAVAVALSAGTGRDPATGGAFFGSGIMLLCATLSFAWPALASAGRKAGRPSARGLVLRNLGRRRGRSLAVIGVLAFGVFMFVGVTVFRRDRLTTSIDRASGTGGYALVGESTTAVVHDLDSAEGRAFYALPATALEGVRVTGVRIRPGDDASCRSMTRAQSPPILGVDAGALTGRFTFVETTADRDDPWTMLRDDLGPEVVPAVIDLATIWTLGRGIGGEIEIEDEGGRGIRFRIVGVIDNSILHGHLIASAAALEKHFPSESGYRRFLIDAPRTRVDAVAAVLTRQLEDRGLALERSEVRLNAYNAVENTYLGIFQALGGLGLILGSVGLALVVGRNTVERRPELALLGALGFTDRGIRRLVAGEHAVLLGAGLLAGLLASLLGLLPALLTPGARVATPTMGLTLLALAGGGMLWTWIATRAALCGPLLDHLRDE